jgi:hypothetical protein
MSFGKGNTTFVMVIGLALIGVASLSACQQGRMNPNGTILVQDDAGSLVVLTPEPTPAQQPKTSVNVSTAAPVQLYSISDPGPAKVGATAPSTFTVKSGSVRVTSLTTYHYVEPDRVPSTGSVGLTGPDGKVYGPWQATGSAGEGGIKNAMWAATIDLVLTPGTYTVTDSDPSTWSSTAGTGGAGMFWITGYPHS